MIFFKILCLQLYWYINVLYSSEPGAIVLWPISILILIINFKIYRVSLGIGKYIFLAIIFSAWGFLQDFLLLYLKVINNTSTIIIFNSLWLIFLSYYGDVFNKLAKLIKINQVFLGAVGGSLSYYFGLKLAGHELENEQVKFLIITVSLSWAAFFPLSLHLYYDEVWWNKLLDRTVIFSFDSNGFKRHRKDYFLKENFGTVANNRYLITGGTGGIGLAVCDSLSANGAEVIFTGRNTELGLELSKDIKRKFFALDMNDWDSFASFAQSCAPFDGIVLNAGGMPIDFSENKYGVESQAGSQLFGHYLLLKYLEKSGKLKRNCKTIWVSSGGMYLKKLDLMNLKSPKDYDRVAVYANVKRAQVTLVEEMSLDPLWKDYKVMAMHPGWVKTEAIKKGLPRFYSFTNKRLRTPAEGADTIVWLLGTEQEVKTGEFYFDRKVVSAYVSSKYLPTKNEREELMSLVNSFYKEPPL